MHDPRRPHIQRRAVRHRRVVVCRCVFALDQQNRLPLEVGCVDDLVLGERMIVGDRDVVERHTGKQLRDQAVGVGNRGMNQADRQPPVAEIS